jgi:hypothetical protein
MAWRQHGRANVSRNSPRAWAVCDDCGFLFNKEDLQFQYEWFGARTQNTNFLKCHRCLDELQEQLRVIVLPSDPVPVLNPRPERYSVDNNPISPIGVSFGTMTQAAGLDAAFDSNTNKPMFMSAVQYNSINGPNTVGRSWLGINPNTGQGIIANRFQVWAPNDAKLFGGGAAAYSFQGSNTPIGFTTISGGTTAGTIGETLDVMVTATTFYLYHQFVLTGDGINSVSVAQLKIYSASSP